MKDTWFYFKLTLIGLLSPLLIIILAGIIYSILGTSDIVFIIEFFNKNNISEFLFKSIMILRDILIIGISSVVIFFLTYLLIPLTINLRWKIISLVTSLYIFLFAYLAPFITTELLEKPNLPVYFDLFSLSIIILINIYIISIFSKRN